MLEEFFQPGLAIFVDDFGKQVYEQFSSMLFSAGLPELLRNHVGLIYSIYTSQDGMQVATSQLASNLFATERQSARNAFRDTKAALNETTAVLVAPLEDTLEHIRLSISQNFGEIHDATYTIDTNRIKIYIIGNTNSKSVHALLQVIREQYFKAQKADEAEVYLLLRPTSPASGNTASGVAVPAEQTPVPVKITYVFEDEADAPIAESVLYYAFAQALYILITTGITSHPAFEEAVQHQQQPGETEHIYYILTRRLTFPRKEMTNYARAATGSELLKQWHESITTPDAIAKTVQRRWRLQFTKAIKHWIGDGRFRPGRLFTSFTLEKVVEEYRSRKKTSDHWADSIVPHIRNKLEEQSKKWQKEITDVWNQRLQRIEAMVKAGLAETINNPSQVQAYIDECRKAFDTLFVAGNEDVVQNMIESFKVSLSSKKAKLQYQEFEDHSAIEDRRLGASFHQILALEQGRTPSVLSLAGIGLIATPPLILLGLALFPAWPTLAVICFGSAFSIVWGLLFYWRQQSKLAKVRKALLALYCLYFEYEPKCKVYFSDYIQASLREMSERIAHSEEERYQGINLIITEARAALQAHADAILDAMFDEAQKRLDIFVDVSGRTRVDHLYVQNALTLQKLTEGVALVTHGRSQQKDGNSYFLKSPQAHLLKLVGKDSQEAQRYVCHLLEESVDAYLKSASLIEADHLDNTIWDQAFSGVRRPPLRSLASKPDLVCICGNPGLVEDGERYARTYLNITAIPVPTDNLEGCLLAAFFRGDAPVSQGLSA